MMAEADPSRWVERRGSLEAPGLHDEEDLRRLGAVQIRRASLGKSEHKAAAGSLAHEADPSRLALAPTAPTLPPSDQREAMRVDDGEALQRSNSIEVLMALGAVQSCRASLGLQTAAAGSEAAGVHGADLLGHIDQDDVTKNSAPPAQTSVNEQRRLSSVGQVLTPRAQQLLHLEAEEAPHGTGGESGWMARVSHTHEAALSPASAVVLESQSPHMSSSPVPTLASECAAHENSDGSISNDVPTVRRREQQSPRSPRAQRAVDGVLRLRLRQEEEIQRLRRDNQVRSVQALNVSQCLSVSLNFMPQV
jgi:hypothetical protein